MNSFDLIILRGKAKNFNNHLLIDQVLHAIIFHKAWFTPVIFTGAQVLDQCMSLSTITVP